MRVPPRRSFDQTACGHGQWRFERVQESADLDLCRDSYELYSALKTQQFSPFHRTSIKLFGRHSSTGHCPCNFSVRSYIVRSDRPWIHAFVGLKPITERSCRQARRLGRGAAGAVVRASKRIFTLYRIIFVLYHTLVFTFKHPGTLNRYNNENVNFFFYK